MEFKISCLLFIRNKEDEVLMIRRRKSPNKGRWSPPGGKLDMACGESPFECHTRSAERKPVSCWKTGILLFWLCFRKGLRIHHELAYVSFRLQEGALLSASRYRRRSFLPLFSTGNRQLGNSANRPRVGLAVVRQAKGGFWGVRAECHLNRPMKLKIEESPIMEITILLTPHPRVQNMEGLHHDTIVDEEEEDPPIKEQGALVEAEQLGRESGRGFFQQADQPGPHA